MIKLSKLNPFSIITSLLAIIFIVYFIFEAKKSRSDIDANLKTTVGRIVKYQTGGNTVSYVTYSYRVNGVDYMGSSSKRAFKGCEDTHWCIGATLTIEYSSINPRNSRINWDAGYVLPNPPPTAGASVRRGAE